MGSLHGSYGRSYIFEKTLLAIPIVGLIISLVLSRSGSKNELIWGCIPIFIALFFLMIWAVFSVLGTLELRYYYQKQSQLLKSISTDYVSKNFSGEFNKYGSDLFITFDRVNNVLVEISVANNRYILRATPLGKVSGKYLEVFHEPISMKESKRNLSFLFDKHGKSVVDNFIIVYKSGQTEEEYHLEQYALH
jgi:hypothetical protein